MIQGTKIIIYNVYAPNNKTEHLTFMKYVNSKLNSLDSNEYEYMVGGGDWNFTYENIDRSGGRYDMWENSINEMHEKKEKFDLIDIWRVKNPEKVRYTWRRKRPLIQSRLDRFYISDTMQYNISQADILPGILSDHSAIILSIKPTKSISQNGPNFWKFNNSLLKNENFAKGLTTFIENDLQKECENIKCKQVKWEYSKYKIKQWSIKKSKEIASEKRKQEKYLVEKIKGLEEKVCTQNSENLLEQLDSCKTDLEKIHNQKTQSLMIQSRVQYYEEGEKSTSFFLNQIKPNKRKSTIRKIMDEEQEVTDQKKIMQHLQGFYEKLYQKDSRCHTGNWIKNLKQEGLVPQLSEEENLNLDAPLTKNELKLTLEKCAKNKSPGNDGLTQEFYSFFGTQ